jgi:hypothetical protein
MTPPRISDDPKSPFGYDEDGDVIAPFGLKADGTPRLSNRGRSAGQGFGAAKKKAAAPPRKAATKPGPAEKPAANARGQIDYRVVAGGLVALASLPFQMAGADPGGFVSRLIGEKQTLALRGDAAILTMFAQPLGNALGGVASVNPWLAAKLEGGNMPKEYVVLAVTTSQLIGALVGNHRAPSQKLADMAEEMAAVQAAEVKRNIDAMRAQQEEDQGGEEVGNRTLLVCEFCTEGHTYDFPCEFEPAQDPAAGPGYAPGPGQRVDDFGTAPFEFQATG